jgi:hypothetical protein
VWLQVQYLVQYHCQTGISHSRGAACAPTTEAGTYLEVYSSAIYIYADGTVYRDSNQGTIFEGEGVPSRSTCATGLMIKRYLEVHVPASQAAKGALSQVSSGAFPLDTAATATQPFVSIPPDTVDRIIGVQRDTSYTVICGRDWEV